MPASTTHPNRAAPDRSPAEFREWEDRAGPAGPQVGGPARIEPSQRLTPRPHKEQERKATKRSCAWSQYSTRCKFPGRPSPAKAGHDVPKLIATTTRRSQL